MVSRRCRANLFFGVSRDSSFQGIAGPVFSLSPGHAGNHLLVYPPGMIKIKGLKGSQVLIDPKVSRFQGPEVGSSKSFMGRV